MTALNNLPPRVAKVITDVLAEIERDPGVRLTFASLQGSATRTRFISRVRFEMWWRIRQLETRWGTPFSYPQIADWFAMPEHSAVIYGVRQWREKVDAGIAPRAPATL